MAFSSSKFKAEKTYAWCRASHEDQRTQVCRTLVAHGTRSIDQSTDTVGLNSGSNQRRAPGGGGRGGLLRLEELLLGIGGLGTVVGVTEDGGENGERGGVVEYCAEGDRRGLDGWKVYEEMGR